VCIANQQLYTGFPKGPLSGPEIPGNNVTAASNNVAAETTIQLAFRPATVFLPSTNYCLLAALHQGN
jgi:hypothetical protein